MQIRDLVSLNLYKNNVEMQNIITSEEKEFESGIKKDVNNVFNDNFIKTATEKGIEQYEKILGISIDKTKGIENRRDAVIVKLLSTAPYTYTRLLEILDTYCGKDNYSIFQDFNKYEMLITTHFIDIEQVDGLLDLFKNIFPANINYEIVNSNLVKITENLNVINYISSNEIINI